jgi:hypothetical protein
MWRVTVRVEENDVFKGSQILADLRTVAETLFYPLKQVGFWEEHSGLHLCPFEARRKPCPHKLPEEDSARVEYSATAQHDMNARLEVSFPHAGVLLYLR